MWLVGHDDRLLYNKAKAPGITPKLSLLQGVIRPTFARFLSCTAGTYFERVHSSCFASGIKALHRIATEQWKVVSGAIGGGGKQIYAVAVSAPVQVNIKSDV